MQDNSCLHSIGCTENDVIEYLRAEGLLDVERLENYKRWKVVYKKFCITILLITLFFVYVALSKGHLLAGVGIFIFTTVWFAFLMRNGFRDAVKHYSLYEKVVADIAHKHRVIRGLRYSYSVSYEYKYNDKTYGTYSDYVSATEDESIIDENHLSVLVNPINADDHIVYSDNHNKIFNLRKRG